MSQEELKTRLMFDLSQINMPIDEVDIFIRPFSKTYYGRYFPVYNEKNDVRPKVYVYPYANTKGDLMDYCTVLETAIHELVHHIQYTSGSFVRNKGVMHNPTFWKIYNHYINRAIKYELLRGGSQWGY